MPSYLGIDVSKDHLDLSLTNQCSRIENSRSAIERLLRKLPADIVPVCESSGGYEAQLISLCQRQSRPIILLNARQVRDFAKAQNRLAKTDRIDARIIAGFAETFHPQPLAARDPMEEKLAALIKQRTHLLAQIQQNANLTSTEADKALLRLIAATVAFLRRQVEKVEALIARVLAESASLHSKVERLQQIQGVGPVAASSMVALMPELGALNDAQAAALAGVAPFNHDSGRFQGKRRTCGGRGRLRSVLYMAALVSSRHNPILRSHYQKLLARGKAKKLALTVLMRKLIVLANKMLKNPHFQIAH